VDCAAEPKWNALLDRFRDANVYQTWAYGAVHWGEDQLSHLVLEQAGEPVALAQLRLMKLPLVRAGVAYLRWGPVCIPHERGWDENVFAAVSRALVQEYVHHRGLLLRVLPQCFDADPASEAIRQGWTDLGLEPEPEVRPYRTIRVDLTAEPEVIRKRFDGKWRNMLNGAERNGLTVSEGTGDELYGQFLAMYDEMMSRKQFDTTVDAREFRRLQQRLPEPQKMLIMISAKDGVPQSGLVATRVGDTGIYLLGATSNDGMKSKGSYLLQWRMMSRLKEHGCRWYDLGGINPEANPGVYHFKAGMGGVEATALGRFELRNSWISGAAVSAGERLRSLVGRLRVNRKQKAEN
jgi:hypothetical protein